MRLVKDGQKGPGDPGRRRVDTRYISKGLEGFMAPDQHCRYLLLAILRFSVNIKARIFGLSA